MLNIIVPAYNCESKIQRLFDSLFLQTNKKFRFICCNDGSTDNTAEILQKNIAKLESFNIDCVLINEENGGVSKAINKCLKYVKTGYILQIDADDELDVNAVETFYHIIEKENFDVFMFDAIRILKNGNKDFFKGFRIENKKDRKKVLKQLMKNQHFCYNPSSRVINVDFLKRIYPTLQIEEDRIGQNYQFLIPTILEAKVFYLNQPLSIVNEYDESLSHKNKTCIEICEKFDCEISLIKRVLNNLGSFKKIEKKFSYQFCKFKLDTCLVFKEKTIFDKILKTSPLLIKIYYKTRIIFKNPFSK